MAIVPYPLAEAIGDRFLALLSNLNIDPPVRSDLESELLSLTNLIEIYKNPALISDRQNYDEILVAAAGLHDLAAKVLSVEGLPEFEEFIPHLRLINGGKFTASVGQNSRSGYDDDNARKIAELYVGCLAAHCGTEIKLDHPVQSKGDNPDVMLSYKGRTWALAIKSVSSRQGQTIFERIAEGIDQIERSNADVGMVVLNTKSAIEHETLAQPAVPFGSLEDAVQALKSEILTLVASVEQDRSQAEWDKLFAGKKAVLPVIFMAQSLAKIPTPFHAMTPTALKMMMCYCANSEADSDGIELSTAMNHFAQIVLAGVPGTEGKPPS